VSAVACTSVEKSANVLSPTVAGPIPGVNIEMPVPLDPKDGKAIEVTQQPVTLIVQNSQTNSQRPLTYLFEVATDSNFSSKVFVRENVPPGDGRTSVRLSDALPTGRTYYWRARAQDGANTGVYSGFAHFAIFTPIVIGRPVLQQPVNNQMLDSMVPRFMIGNAPRSGPVGAISYMIEVADSDSFANKIAIWTTPEQSGQTGFNAPSGLPANRQHFWRVQAFDSNGAAGDWSSSAVFRTPPILEPTPTLPLPPTGNCPLPQPTPYQTLQCARAGYPHPMSAGQRGALLNLVAWHHRAAGWGLHLKPGGNNCPQPRTGTLVSCDILVHGPSGGVYDVLLDEEVPTWGYKGPINTSLNFVAPVQP
jgi:hypothetical protein